MYGNTLCYSKYMTLRFGNLYVDGIYHVFNRGVDKRQVFMDTADERHFLELLQAVNREESIGNLRDYKMTHDIASVDEPLVEIIAFTLQGNHYHMLLRQIADDGLSRYMHKLSTGYTRYINQKYSRTGALFQGKYKYIETKHDAQIMRLICYINRNEEVHGHSSPTTVICSRGWFTEAASSPWLAMFTDYAKQEQSIINDIKRERIQESTTSELLE